MTNTAKTIIVNLDASFGCNKLGEPSEGMFSGPAVHLKMTGSSSVLSGT